MSCAILLMSPFLTCCLIQFRCCAVVSPEILEKSTDSAFDQVMSCFKSDDFQDKSKVVVIQNQEHVVERFSCLICG